MTIITEVKNGRTTLKPAELGFELGQDAAGFWWRHTQPEPGAWHGPFRTAGAAVRDWNEH